MLSIIGAALIIFACAAFATKKIAAQSKAIDTARGLKQAFLHIARKMEFDGEPLPMLFNQVSAEDLNEAADFFSAVYKGLTDGENRTLEEVWREVLNTYSHKLALSPATVRIMAGVGSRLGKMAQTAELEALGSAADELDEEVRRLEEEFSKSSRLLKSSGILVGILIVILFI